MKRHFLLLFLISAVTLFSCKNDDDQKGDLKLTYKAIFDGDSLVLNSQEVWYFDRETMVFSKLNLFISDLSVEDVDGNSTSLAEIDFIDFELSNRTPDGAIDGLQRTYELEPGRYQSMTIGLGVPPALNAKMPSEFSGSHPLAQFGSHWTAWDSFIFSKTEGLFDSNGDDQPDLGFAYHIGSDDMYRRLTVNGDFEIVEGEETEMVITLDYKKVFGTNDDHIDIVQYPTFHSPQDPTLKELTEDLANQFAGAFSFRVK